MANGWTNANNFKPWTQYNITPGAEDIVISKGSYLSQDITVHGDPNYASCNIVQGASVGDIRYGSANTAIDNFGCGTYYPKNIRTPYVVLDNLLENQTIDNFHNHMGVAYSQYMHCFHQNTYYSKYQYSYSDSINWRLISDYDRNFKAGQVYSGKAGKSELIYYAVANTNTVKNTGGIVGYFGAVPTQAKPFKIIDDYYLQLCADYHTCFIHPIPSDNNDEAFYGLLQNGNNYLPFYCNVSGICMIVQNESYPIYISQNFVGAELIGDTIDYTLFCAFNKGKIYLNSDNNIMSLYCDNSNYNITDMCSNKKDRGKLYIITRENLLYNVEATNVIRTIRTFERLLDELYICVDDLSKSYTQWITYLSTEDKFIIGSPYTPYVFLYDYNNDYVEYSDNLDFLSIGLPYYPCHCFFEAKYENNDIVILMYYNLIYVIYIGTKENSAIVTKLYTTFHIRG